MTSTTSSAIKLTNQSLNNFQQWKRSLDATYSKHPDKLLSVVQDGKLSVTTELKIRQAATAAGADPDKMVKAHKDELDTSAYYILIDTIASAPLLKTIERKFGDDNNAGDAYDYICSLWKLDEDKTDEYLVAKNNKRDDYVRAGPTSGTLEHVTTYVEAMLEMNEEFKGTSFHWNDNRLTTQFLTALRKHEPTLVDGYRSSRTETNWKNDFEKNWAAVGKLLESKDDETDDLPPRNTDVLSTETAPSDIEKWMQAQATINEDLLERVAAILATKTNATRGTSSPNCEHCGIRHRPDSTHGCIGKAIFDGKITAADAKKLFSRASDPDAMVKTASERYEAHQAKLGKPVTKPNDTKSTGFKLTKSYNMCLTVQNVEVAADPPQPQQGGCKHAAAAIGESNHPWPYGHPLHDRLSGVSDRPGHKNK